LTDALPTQSKRLVMFESAAAGGQRSLDPTQIKQGDCAVPTPRTVTAVGRRRTSSRTD
jgi:hypothetical protein